MRRRVDALPADVLALLLRFLSGFDLLPLSHADRRLYHGLLTPNGVVWASRLPSRPFVGVESARVTRSRRWRATYKKVVGGVKELVRSRSTDGAAASDEDRPSWKKLYFSSSSLRFPGCPPGFVVERQRGGAVQLWDGLYHAWNADAFSLDVWFALLPETDDSLAGGILLAAQGTEWPGVKYGDDAQQFIHVDTEGNLFCSMLREKSIIASSLVVYRWYHIAVSVERLPDDWWKASQRVYLDGRLVQDAQGSVHPRWRYLNHAQLGSGVIEGNSPGAPCPQHRGWYGFNGVVDDFRFWTGAINEDHVERLFQGQEDTVCADGWSCVWSMKQDRNRSEYGTTIRSVRSTRPREQRCLSLRPVGQM